MNDEEKAALLRRASAEIGRPAWLRPTSYRYGPPLAPITAEEARTLWDAGYSMTQIARMFGVSRSTVERRLGKK